jgi:cytochrome c553
MHAKFLAGCFIAIASVAACASDQSGSDIGQDEAELRISKEILEACGGREAWKADRKAFKKCVRDKLAGEDGGGGKGGEDCDGGGKPPKEPKDAGGGTPPVDRPAEVAKLTGDPASGKTVYETSSAPTCASCHKADGKGDIGPALAEPSKNDTAQVLAKYILDGVGSMPKQTALSDQQIADLIAYMKATFK